MSNAIFITVRSNSIRLPAKAYKKINNKCTIEYVIDQAKKSKLANKIILCTTKLKEDDLLCQIAQQNNINFFRGNEKDKLVRWKAAAANFNIDFFVTADGDDLFCSHELMDLAFLQYDKNNPDFIKADDTASGCFTYGIKTDALNKVCDIKDTDETEMMWVYFTDTGLFNVENLKNIPEVFKRNNIRMTLDYEDDLKFFDTVINGLGKKAFNTRDVLSFLDENPLVVDINYYLEKIWKDNQLAKTNLVIKKC